MDSTTAFFRHIRNNIVRAGIWLNKAIDKYGMIEFNDNVKNIVDEILSEQEVVQTPQVKKLTRKAKKQTN